jgi:S-adenosylmethionine:diacylglycerol 3-amino-3-carboxypropyl transferase
MMSHIFDFGISQDDASIEKQALDIKDGDSLLCISSAGEVPLNLLALNNIKIQAIDISENQNHLVRLKLGAIRSLEPFEAAKFLGFMKTTKEHRIKLFNRVSEFLSEEDLLFWDINSKVIEKGPICTARFEKYIRKYNRIALMIIGRRNLLRLFELDSIKEQNDFFDTKINSYLLEKIFQIAFHPRFYKNKGIASEGFIHNDEKNIGALFFNKFKDFCCGTLARKNYYLQFTFFNQIIFPEAFPEYLT